MPRCKPTETDRALMRELRWQRNTCPRISEITGWSISTVHRVVRHIPIRLRPGMVPGERVDLDRHRRIAAAHGAAEWGDAEALARRFGLANRKSFAKAARRARQVLAAVEARG